FQDRAEAQSFRAQADRPCAGQLPTTSSIQQSHQTLRRRPLSPSPRHLRACTFVRPLSFPEPRGTSSHAFSISYPPRFRRAVRLRNADFGFTKTRTQLFHNESFSPSFDLQSRTLDLARTVFPIRNPVIRNHSIVNPICRPV